LLLSDEQIFKGVEKSLRKYFGKRGEQVVTDNLKAVERGYREVIEVPREIMLATADADRANAGLRVMSGGA
jgi:pyruvate-ferredoxin/flavodoxin oxidoreductase